jgi:hypothetical protein
VTPAVTPVTAAPSPEPPINAGARTYVNRRTGERRLIHPTNLEFMPNGADWDEDTSIAPIQQAPMVAPMMAMSRSMGLGGWEPALGSLKNIGIDDDTIQQAMREMGIA